MFCHIFCLKNLPIPIKIGMVHSVLHKLATKYSLNIFHPTRVVYLHHVKVKLNICSEVHTVSERGSVTPPLHFNHAPAPDMHRGPEVTTHVRNARSRTGLAENMSWHSFHVEMSAKSLASDSNFECDVSVTFVSSDWVRRVVAPIILPLLCSVTACTRNCS